MLEDDLVSQKHLVSYFFFFNFLALLKIVFNNLKSVYCFHLI